VLTFGNLDTDSRSADSPQADRRGHALRAHGAAARR
jgi:hypothetical protein